MKSDPPFCFNLEAPARVYRWHTNGPVWAELSEVAWCRRPYPTNMTEADMRMILQIVINAVYSFFIPRRHATHQRVALPSAIYETAPIGITLNDLQGEFVRTNPAYQSMTGFTKAELHAETRPLIHSEDYPRLAFPQELLAGQKERPSGMSCGITKGGAVILSHSTVSILKENYSAPRYIVIVARSERYRELAKEAAVA